MADETNPAAPGAQTSEFKLTVVAMVLGTVLEGVGTLLHQLQDVGVNAPWFTTALAILGAVTQIAALFGYTKGRAVVKSALIAANSDAPAPPK